LVPGIFSKWFGAAGEPARRQALADVYVPILRGFLLPAIFYYGFVTWGHWRDERGLAFVLLGGLSAFTILVLLGMRRLLPSGQQVSLGRVELVGLVANLLIYLNTLVYMLVHFEEAKLIYFVLMAVVFSHSGVTLRSTVFCVGLAMASMFGLTRQFAPQSVEQYVFIGVAGSFASLGMAFLLRTALRHQVGARLRADALTLEANRIARTDPLTGLPNRRAIFQSLDERVRKSEACWLGLIDLDGFKAVNDAYGHVFGNELLLAVANRAKAAIGPDMVFGRLGGDEFALVASGALSDADMDIRARRLIATLSEPYDIGHVQALVGASVGLCNFPHMATDSQTLYEYADFALARAKSARRGGVFLFDQDHQKQMVDTIAMDRALREGNLEEELYVVFQPQFALREKRIIGFEALARWRSPHLGEVRPDIFIRAAERSGYINRMTPILFRKALAEARRWPEDVSLSFNLSTRDLTQASHAHALLEQIRQAGIALERVEFEITETAVMLDIDMSRRLLLQLSSAGCRIALDDFGSGYSSFAYLDQLALDKVKIDKSFVRKVSVSTASREILASLIHLCRTLKLDCVLEGVETNAELDLLRPLDPDIIQGFLFGRPMSGDHAVQLVSDELFAMQRSGKVA